MEIHDTPNSLVATAAPGQTAFAFGFTIFADSDLAVTVDGVTATLAEPADTALEYQVDFIAEDEGGTITFGAALAGGETVTIQRDVPIERLADFPSSGPLSTRALNKLFDRLVVYIQDAAALARASVVTAFRAELGGVSGAGLVGFLGNWTGATLRSLQARLRDTPFVTDFGSPVGNDWTIVLNRVIAALNAGEIQSVYQPAGDYRTTSALTPLTRRGISWKGAGQRVTKIMPQGSFDGLRFVSTNPLTTRIDDLHVSGFSIDYGDVVAPTAGVALTLDRIDRSSIDVGLNNVFAGLLVRGGADSEIKVRSITSAYSWSSVAVGSYLAKFTYYPGTTELPSEITIGDINWKGSDDKLENAIIVEAADGLFFSTGHTGFASLAQLKIVAQPYAWCSILNLQMGTVYLDGNRTSANPTAGNAAGAAVDISGSALATVSTIDLSQVTIANVAGKGVRSVGIAARNLKLGGDFINVGKEHVDLNGVATHSLVNAHLENGNAGNGGSSAVKLVGCGKWKHIGNSIFPGTYPHPKGFDYATAVDGVSSGNQTESIAIDYSVAAGCDRIKFSANLKVGAQPTVVAADSFVLPMGFDTVVMTGNSSISYMTAQLVTGHRVMLRFTGTVTINSGIGSFFLDAAFTSTPGSTLTIECDGAKWIECGRSIV